jgi:hypothetical protein
VEFNNLYEFFNYIEFCPLCKKRLTPAILWPTSNGYRLTGQQFVCYWMEKDNDIIFNINLLNNDVDVSNSYLIHSINSNIIIGQRCNKYHFQYTGSFSLNINTKKINNIKLNKYHLLQRISDNYFSINTYFDPNILTSIKVSGHGNETKEITLDTIFNIDSKKKIINKLRNIALLI